MTLTPKGKINREGRVSFGDASLNVWEEGLSSRMTHKERDAWELAFKRQVFARIIQTLNRIGWTVGPWDDADKYKCIALSRRTCRKGDLHGELSVDGRHIEFKMWQDVTPSENPNGGRYDFDKEKRMPYVLRLEMERTRRRIRDYLCNVFTEYSFKERTPNFKPASMPALEWIASRWAENEHANPDEWEDSARRDVELDPYNRKSGDGFQLEHGQRVYTTDYHGRWLVGHAYKDGGMWDVVVSHLRYERKSANELYVTSPPDLRSKRNDRQRRGRLESELAKAVKAMDFKRAEVLKGILWPKPEPLFHIVKDGAYFRPNYSGYTSNPVDAGKYTKDELRHYAGDIKNGSLQAVPVTA